MHPISVLTILGALLCLFRHISSTRTQRRRLPPGPKGRPIVGNLGMIPHAKPWVFFQKLGYTYGPVSCISILGHPVVLLNSFGAVDTLFNKRSSRYSLKPRRRMAELVGFTATIPFMNPGASWSKARKLFYHELGSVSIRQHNGAQERAAQALLRRICRDQANLGDKLDLTFGELALHVACGHDVQSPNDNLLRSTVEIARNGASILAGSYNFVDTFSFVRTLPSWFPWTGFRLTAMEWRSQLLDACQASYTAAKAEVQSGSTTSFMASTLTNLGENITPEDEEILRFSTVTMHAGGVLTTRSSLLSFFLAMTLYPESQRRAQSEIDYVVGRDRLPAMTDREALPYTRCLIEEVLRWNPVAPLISRQAHQDDEYDGHFIPKGATVVANVWALARDPIAFPDPEIFRPERFLEHDLHDKMKSPRYFTFGFGRRVCPGAVFADFYLFIVIARLLASFDICQSVNANGDTIPPKVEFTTGATSEPFPFKFNIKARSDKALSLIHSNTT